MKQRVPLILLSIFILLLLNGCWDFACMFEMPEDKNELVVHEIILNGDFNEPEILRTSSFQGEGNNIPYEHEFTRMHYSFDGVTSYFWNGKKGFMTYGFDKSIFSQPLEITHPPFLDYYSSPQRWNFDYQLSTNESIYNGIDSYLSKNPFSNDSVNSHIYTLKKYNHSSAITDTLLENKPVFLDSMTVKNTRIFDQRFTPDGQILLIAGSLLSEIFYNKNSNYFGTVVSQRKMYLLKLNDNLTLDTLFTHANGEDNLPYFELFLSNSKIFLNFEGSIYQFDKNTREIQFLYEGMIPQNISTDEQTLTFNKGKKYFNFETNEVIDLSEYFRDIIFSIPHQNLVAIQNWPNRDKLFIFDVNSKSVIKTILYDDLPGFNEVSGISKFRLENPVFTSDGHLIFMKIRHTYLEDEDYNSRCK